MGCGQRNIHSYQPTTLAGWVTLAACYMPMGIVLCLVLGCMIPYLYWYAYGYAIVIATRPSDAILAYWCWGGAIPLFTALLVSYFRCVFTSPGYSAAPQWCHPPRILHADGHVRPSNPQSLNCSVVAAPGNPTTVFQYPSTAVTAITVATASSATSSGSGTGGRTTVVIEDATVVSPSATQSAAAAPPQPPPPPAPPATPIYHGYFTPRFCERCRMYRPQGSHHCSDCNRCVLAMDHHCPWVCNCVGARNHKYFVLFLFYIFASGVHIALTIGAGYVWFDAASRATLIQHTVNVMVGISAGVFALAMGSFFGFHIFLIASETTTVDRNIAALKGLRRNNKAAEDADGGSDGRGAAIADGGAAVVVVTTQHETSGGSGRLAAASGGGNAVARQEGGGGESGGGAGFSVADGRIAGIDDDDEDPATRSGQSSSVITALNTTATEVVADDVAVPINSDDESEAVHKAARASFSVAGNPIRRLFSITSVSLFAAVRACGLCLTRCFCRGLTPHQLKTSLAATLGAPGRTVGVLIWFIPVAPTWPHPHPARRGEWTTDPPEKVSPYVPTTVNYEGYVLVPPAPSLLMLGSPFPPAQQQQPSPPLTEER